MQLNQTALLLIDLQNDFLPGGSLAVPSGDEVVPIANQLLTLPFAVRIATLDWHPERHISFASSHVGKQPGDDITLNNGQKQILWPTHCLQGSWGASLSPKINASSIDFCIYKGTSPSIDSYSAFFDNERCQATSLASSLHQRKISALCLLGLATDYCVLYSVVDGLSLGFQVSVVIDGCRGITPMTSHAAFRTMQKNGAQFITSQELLLLG